MYFIYDVDSGETKTKSFTDRTEAIAYSNFLNDYYGYNTKIIFLPFK